MIAHEKLEKLNFPVFFFAILRKTPTMPLPLARASKINSNWENFFLDYRFFDFPPIFSWKADSAVEKLSRRRRFPALRENSWAHGKARRPETWKNVLSLSEKITKASRVSWAPNTRRKGREKPDPECEEKSEKSYWTQEVQTQAKKFFVEIQGISTFSFHFHGESFEFRSLSVISMHFPVTFDRLRFGFEWIFMKTATKINFQRKLFRDHERQSCVERKKMLKH